MLNTEIKIVSILKADTTLTATVPANNISVGPVDISIEKQSELRLPSINIHQVSESMRSVPEGARDSVYQLDIWSRNNQMEVENIYERVLTDLDFISYDQGGNHVFWERLSGAVDEYQSEMRIWHRSCTFVVWGI